MYVNEGGVPVNEDTVRTARETASHSTETPIWANPPAFAKDVFTFARVIFHVEVTVEPTDFEPEPAPAQPAVSYSGGGPEQPSALAEAAAAGGAVVTTSSSAAEVAQGGNGAGDGTGENPVTVVKSDQEKIGRNDPCWCGSGKKYKKCHGA